MADDPTDDDRPQFARVRGDGEVMADLRQQAPRFVLDVLDALALARGDRDRTRLVMEILEEAALKELHRLSFIHRIAGSNPTVLESLGIESVKLRGRMESHHG